MRQNLIIALLSVCCTLLAVDVYVSLRAPQPFAFGQGTATPTTGVAIAAVQGQGSEPWVYLYDTTNNHLACYTTKQQGIELKGVREVTWDLQIPELPPMGQKRITVKEMKALADKSKGGKD